MKLFSKYFPYKKPDKKLQIMYNSKIKADNYSKVSSLFGGFDHLAEKVREMPSGTDKKGNTKILNIVNKILGFNEQNQQGCGLKSWTPHQMLSRLPISLAQLQAENDSEKFKNEIRQLLYPLYRSKTIYRTLIYII